MAQEVNWWHSQWRKQSWFKRNDHGPTYHVECWSKGVECKAIESIEGYNNWLITSLSQLYKVMITIDRVPRSIDQSIIKIELINWWWSISLYN